MLIWSTGTGSLDFYVGSSPMVRRPVLAMFAVIAMVLGGVVVSTPAGAVADSVVVVASPSPGTGSNNLSSVSCVSSSFCVAVGNYNNGSAGQTLVVSLTDPEPVPNTTTLPPSTTTTLSSPGKVVPAFTG